MHRISDTRMLGDQFLNLQMLESLCGKRAAERVVFVTTMWDQVNEKIGERREKELISRFWASMIRDGAKTARFDNRDEQAAYQITEELLHWHDLRQAILLQHEAVELGRHLHETLAAQVLYSYLQNRATAQRKRLQSLQKMLKKTQYTKIYAELLQEYNRIETEHDKTVQQMEDLKPTWFQRILVIVRTELEEKGKQDIGHFHALTSNIPYIGSTNSIQSYRTA